jgi:hypothetical protein
MRKHYEHAEKQAGYDCIRCYVKRGNGWKYQDGKFTEHEYLAVADAFESFFVNFAWPGGYPIVFLTDDGDCLCAECAKRVFIMEKIDVSADCYYEGPAMFCDGCNREIESAYGDPESEKE